MRYTELVDRRLAQVAGRQLGLFTRADARAAGVGPSAIDRRLREGTWVRLQRGVYRSATTPATREQTISAACLAAGVDAVASHRSAAWLWGLVDAPPEQPDITVPHRSRPGVSRVTVHRSRMAVVPRCTQRGVPCTGPGRTMVDVAAVVDEPVLDGAVDRVLARRLISTHRLIVLAAGERGHGRTGPPALCRSLDRAGLVVPPHPSVLERRTLRLLVGAGITPLAVEAVAGPQGEYRLDILLAPGLALEVDGFAWHSSARQKTHDERRRNQIRLTGTFLLVATWMDVVHDSERFLATVQTALLRHGGAA